MLYGILTSDEPFLLNLQEQFNLQPPAPYVLVKLESYRDLHSRFENSMFQYLKVPSIKLLWL